MPLTVGTAGHIDHGKTWLVRALTGKDTDRLPEEQARGISIDLGYAPLELPDGRRLSVVDVPGHERFVRTMVAGATGIDLFLLVIDASEGARPQTHEHLAILRLLGIERGVVAVTKADAVDAETLELAVEEARELVPEAEVVAVSAKTGAGLDELRAALARAAGRDARRPRSRRASTSTASSPSAGIGTVVTGTLWSGSIGEGDELRVEPAGLDVRVRSVQVHDRAVDRAEAGQRVAVALPGSRADATSHRGDVLVEPGAYRPSYRLDVVLEELEEIPAGARVQVHHGTPPRLRGSSAPAITTRSSGSRGRSSPRAATASCSGTAATIGGGVVLDPLPPRRLDPERLARIESGDVAATISAPVREDSLRHLIGASEPEGVERTGDWLYSAAWLEELNESLRAELAHADPLDPGIQPPQEPWADAVVPLLGLERRGAKLYLPGAASELGDRAADAGRARSAPRRRAGQGRRPAPRDVPRAAGPARPGRRRLRDQRRGLRRSRSGSCSTSAPPPARSRSPASATSPAAAAATRSSYSSASTRTA